MSAELAAELATSARKRVVDPRTVPVRFSHLRQIAKSALHYHDACQGNGHDTSARKLGKLTHALTLGQPVEVFRGGHFNGKDYKGVRNGAYWDHFRKEHPGVEICIPSEYEDAKPIADAVRSHPIAGPMLLAPSQCEIELDWTHPLGRDCQSHLDIYRRGAFVADLKTARTSDPAWFTRTAIYSGYHAQLAFYVEAVEALGHETPDAYIIAVESAPPYAVTVMQLTPRAIEAGRRACRLWFEQLLCCEASGEWPAYAQTVVELDVPDEDDGGDGYPVVVAAEDIEF